MYDTNANPPTSASRGSSGAHQRVTLSEYFEENPCTYDHAEEADDEQDPIPARQPRRKTKVDNSNSNPGPSSTSGTGVKQTKASTRSSKMETCNLNSPRGSNASRSPSPSRAAGREPEANNVLRLLHAANKD